MPSAPSGETSPQRPGFLDKHHTYEATVWVRIPELAEAHGKPPQCSGTVIGPRLVVTAAHCVCKEKRDVTPEAMAKASASAKDKLPPDVLLSRAQAIKGNPSPGSSPPPTVRSRRR